ncbi:hypothetical protein K2173_018122 [Erythroxylum novogranatense]|uniref:Uncharacterized protein n=1 Tax=Erythroxylum novogranatense TaxID=1862640 RepID=A0AAV8U976_9ROSI|nr:hypothetical protein K2173_018122 [Erythroxylum novogranatense]
MRILLLTNFLGRNSLAGLTTTIYRCWTLLHFQNLPHYLLANLWGLHVFFVWLVQLYDFAPPDFRFRFHIQCSLFL